MDYEKKCKEILSLAKSYQGNSLREFLDLAFSESKESEDEKVRQEIEDFLLNGIWNNKAISEVRETQRYSKWIAYLERQKEQKPVEWSNSVAKEMFIKALERAVEQTKKGYELTDCDKHSWWEDFKAYSGIKPTEWSEDIRNWKNIAYYVLKEWLGIGQYMDNPALEEIAKELQKRYGSVSPVSVPQWSEEDEMHLNWVIEHFRQSGELYHDLIAWLKSLRPQSVQEKIDGAMHVADKFEEGYKAGVYDTKAKSWKPSDVQMDALAWYSGNSGVPPTGDKAIKSLYDDLQKLL